jgi:hypothetical protein
MAFAVIGQFSDCIDVSPLRDISLFVTPIDELVIAGH